MRDSSRVRSGYSVLHKFAVAQQSALALLPLNGLVHTPDLVYTYLLITGEHRTWSHHLSSCGRQMPRCARELAGVSCSDAAVAHGARSTQKTTEQ